MLGERWTELQQSDAIGAAYPVQYSPIRSLHKKASATEYKINNHNDARSQ
jgi:hypothetical protein